MCELIYPTQVVLFTRLRRSFKGADPEDDTRATFWFESESEARIQHPPDFSLCKNIDLGDIFLHRTTPRCQLWIWAVGGDGIPYWKPVMAGYRRKDGRRLVVTDTLKIPSWVSTSTFDAKFKHRSEFSDLPLRTLPDAPSLVHHI